MDARASGYDTVLSLRKDSCLSLSQEVACSDDAVPPGGFGSRIAALLQPGTYFLIVDGAGASSGLYTLSVNLVNGCVPICTGKFCGNDGCGGDCGACGAGQVCNSSARCVDAVCTPSCNGRKCGDDGCGGTCGQCAAGDVCFDGGCVNVPTCDRFLPVCKNACGKQKYCGTDCACHDAAGAAPIWSSTPRGCKTSGFSIP
jgi:hypothetical protein